MATPQAQEDVIDAQQLALTEALAAAAGQAARRWALSHAAEAGGWAALDGTAEWVALMAAGGRPDTRSFLRPVYKACKNLPNDRPTVAKTRACWTPHQTAASTFNRGRGGGGSGGKADGDRSGEDSDDDASSSWREAVEEEVARATRRWEAQPGRHFLAAVAVGEWLVQLSTVGDAALGIPPQPQLQPSFAFNTILTMCQRSSAAPEARVAYGRMACVRPSEGAVYSGGAAAEAEAEAAAAVEAEAAAEAAAAVSAEAEVEKEIAPAPAVESPPAAGTNGTHSRRRRRVLRRSEVPVPCDVFTLTALLDVLGRAHDAEGAFWVFRRMKDPAVHGLTVRALV